MLLPILNNEILIRILGSAVTLYMMVLLIRWLGPYLEVDLHAGRWAWVPKIADPPIKFFRRILPDMGPFDWSPIAAIFAVYFARLVLLSF